MEGAGWTAVWATSAQMPSKTMGPNWSEEKFSNHTLRQVIRVSQGGVGHAQALATTYRATGDHRADPSLSVSNETNR